MTRIHRCFFATLVVACAACGAPSAVAQDAPEPVAPVASGEHEAENFKTVCSIAIKDLDAGVSIYVEEGWEVVNCSPWVNTVGTAPIVHHCCYLTR